jgi:hypothetical protein
MKTKFNPSLIFDVGHHDGEDTNFYLAKGFRVVAVEAMASLCDAARERFKSEIASEHLVIESVAVADSAGPVTFYQIQTLCGGQPTPRGPNGTKGWASPPKSP